MVTNEMQKNKTNITMIKSAPAIVDSSMGYPFQSVANAIVHEVRQVADCRSHSSVNRPIGIDDLTNMPQLLPEIQRIFLHNNFFLDNNPPNPYG